MPRCGLRLTPESRGRGAEADPAFAREPLDVDDSTERDRVAAVLGFERKCRLAAPGAQLGGAEGLFKLVGTRRRDEGAHHLATVESDLDPDAFQRTADIALKFGVIKKPAGPRAYTHEIWELARKR